MPPFAIFLRKDQNPELSNGLYFISAGICGFSFLISCKIVYLLLINALVCTVERLTFEEFFNHPYLSRRQLDESFR